MKKILKALAVTGVAAVLTAGLVACNNDDDNGNSGGGSQPAFDIEGGGLEIIDWDDGYVHECDPDFCWFCDFNPDNFAPDGGFGDDWVNPLGNPDPALSALMDNLLTGVEEPEGGMPMTENWELTADNFEMFVMVDYIPGARGVISQAMINVIPHMVALIELPAGTDATAVAAQIESAADPARWICTEAEALEVAAQGHFVVVAMTWETVANGVMANVPAVLGFPHLLG